MLRMSSMIASVAAATAAGSWSVISAQVGQGATGLGFFDAQHGIIAATDGLGYNVYLSSDGGKTWPTTVPNSNFYLFPLFDTAAFASSGVAVGQFDTQFTINQGAFFNTSIGGGGAGVARVLGTNQGFGLVGTFGNDNGIAISTDLGLTFASMNASLTLPSNFGTFPTTTTFFVTGATAPQSADDNTGGGTTTTGGGSTTTGGGSTSAATGVYRITPHLSIVAEKNGPARHVFEHPVAATGGSVRGRSLQTGGYAGEVTKTTDGGNTWTTVFSSTGAFAVNGIDSIDGKAVAFVAEAATGSSAGAFIYTAKDGSTFTQTLNTTTAGASLVDIRALSATEFWAVGGVATSSAISASFYHSVDGGNTWTLDTSLPNYFATGIECHVASGSCWATVIDASDNSFVAALSS